MIPFDDRTHDARLDPGDSLAESSPVMPEDIAATIYHALGLDPELLIADRFDRPEMLAQGRPITALFG